MNKEEQVLSYLYDKIFLDVINSKTASKKRYVEQIYHKEDYQEEIKTR